MKYLHRVACTFGIVAALASTVLADSQPTVVEKGRVVHAVSDYFDIEVSAEQPQFQSITVDSLGSKTFRPCGLRPPAASTRPTKMMRVDSRLEYRAEQSPTCAPPRWTIVLNAKEIVMLSCWSETDLPEPIVFDFNADACHATLLGRTTRAGSIRLPALLHLPDRGTLRITSNGGEDVSLGCEPGPKICLPPATQTNPRLEYRLEIVAIHPQIAGIEKDVRFDGFRRGWLNILQLNPRRQVLANNTNSDNCAFTLYEYADMARHTPPLAEGLTALDLVRQSLDRYLAGMTGYGMTGHDYQGTPNRSPTSMDSYPSLLIAAANCVEGADDTAWLEQNYPRLAHWASLMLATDRDQNGLLEYPLSGNSGSWAGSEDGRPSNWWDCIGFGHEDAYGNALAYRALGDIAVLAARLGRSDDEVRYRTAARKLHNAYFTAFYNPRTGILAGWRSADGQLHDYDFLFVNGIAVHYGLVPRDRADAVMDRLLARIKEVGYTRFDLGLPGNLSPVLPKDYFTQEKRWGGGPDGFQIYENGGATAAFAYFTLAALYDLGRYDEADRILFPMLDAFEKGSFQGRHASGLTNDWKTWDGTAQGYEGLLVDNYYALLAILVRNSRHRQ